MQISKYFASLSVDVDTRSIRKVDKFLKDIEKKLKNFKGFGKNGLSFGISNFTVDQRKLNLVLGNSLDRASGQVRFEVSRFVVNERNLQAALTRASRRVNVTGQTSVGRPAPLTGSEFDRRRGVLGQEAALRHQRQLELAQLRGVRSPGRIAGGAATGGGLIARGASGILAPALALGLGGYGLGALNQRNQQVVSAQLQSQAVVQQAGGTAEQGQASFQYLRSEGNRIGFNYLDASGDYNKLISGLTGSGIGLGESQKVFSGFAELARVNKLDKTTQNRLFRALSQVAGKGKLMSEELTGQIAEALPGGTALFAQAYQAKLGGNKTGADAIQQLLADMKKGKVTSDILTYAGAAASQRANAGGALASASTASQAEQARYQNSVNDMAVLASNSGVEEGFARIFRTLNAGLSESGGLVRSLSEGFNEATKWADDLVLFPQDFVRALEGRDSLVASWLGQDATKQLQEDWKSIRDSLTTISGIGAPTWLPTLETVSKDIAAQFKIIAAIANGDFSAIGEGLKEFGVSRLKTVGDAVATGPNFALRTAGELFGVSVPQVTTEGISYRAPRAVREALNLGESLNRLPSLDPLTNARNDTLNYSDALGSEFGSQQAALESKQRVTNNSNQINIEVNIDGATLQGFDANSQAQAIGEAVANMFVQSFEQVNVNFPVGE